MSFDLIILGSSSALPTSERNLPAHVLNVHERFFLIDCGEATQIHLRQHRIGFGKINHIFISHLHGDHTYGLFGLLSSFSMMGRKTPLHIYADPKLETILLQHFTDFDVHVGYTIHFHHLSYGKTGLIYEDNILTVHSFPLKHRIPACGFLFREKPKMKNIRKDLVEKYKIPVRDIVRIKAGQDYVLPDGKRIPNRDLTFERSSPRSYAYCSDTRYYESVIRTIRGVNLLFHEATYGNELAQLAYETFHCTAAEAARLAKKARVGKLVIGHFSARYKDPSVLLDEARQIFPETFLAEDGLVIRL